MLSQPDPSIAPLPDGISLRPETIDDRAWLAELYVETRAAEFAQLPWPETAKRALLLDQFRCQHAQYASVYPSAEFLVIERDRIPIGRLYLDRREHAIRIIDIALIASERGRGIGAALIGRLIAEAARNASELTLHVESNNPAQCLYARLGFRLLEDRGVYLLLGWRPV